MTTEAGLKRGFALGVFLAAGVWLLGEAIHWFLSSSAHPEASQLRTLAVVTQAAIGFTAALWTVSRLRTESRRANTPATPGGESYNG